jgi:hypothetical protein
LFFFFGGRGDFVVITFIACGTTDEGKSKRLRAEEDGERKSRKSDKKEKRADKKSHKDSKRRHSDKGFNLHFINLRLIMLVC